MIKSVIITDTSCDFPEGTLKDLPIKVLEMPVALKDNPEKDISSLDIREFYDLMRKGKILPTTSQVNVARFMDCFKECLENGMTPIVIGLSAKLTKSYEAAIVAKNNMPEPEKVIIIDSKCASLGLGLVVIKAARMAVEGYLPEEIARESESYASRMEHIFTVDSLEHLKRGGRLSATQAFVGGLLNIKPILHLVDGGIEPLEKVRGKKNALKRMLEIMGERAKNFENQVVGISHADDEEGAKELAMEIKQRYNPKDVVISWIGPVIGAHAGPGTLAVFFERT
ncbi:EDD domain protein, DegV family [Caldanaerovirga acetigignens]|uniref:EDD domain protein, DegV family n=1 Tax=Caldanaerovirga acetigignens TaxID=447595 RepID=A0A1M7LTW5_9FIRM|nr:DegV family protein [Caldanaerovirga acetigignens]SHM81693.1 EDD domain protein, DegV family [Caldanaerovirga acetigignens]